MKLAEQTKIGKAVWDGFGDDARKAELSHWRGFGKFSDEARWYGIGKRTLKHVDRILAQQRRRGFWDERRAILEWGSGGGANAVAFADRALVYYGVDISEKNLSEAARQMREAGSEAFRPLLVADEPAAAMGQIEAPVDVFFSTAVFQHFPSRDYGAEVLRAIASKCREGAVGFVQIRYADSAGKRAGNARVEDYAKNYITATAYPIDAFWTLCEACGFTVVAAVDLSPKNNYLTFYLAKGVAPERRSRRGARAARL